MTRTTSHLKTSSEVIPKHRSYQNAANEGEYNFDKRAVSLNTDTFQIAAKCENQRKFLNGNQG
jgi:hypothetical protein